MAYQEKDIWPIDCEVKTLKDFANIDEFQRYVREHWQLAIIHNQYVENVLLGQVVAKLKTMIELLEDVRDELGFDGGYDDEEIDEINKMWGH